MIHVVFVIYEVDPSFYSTAHDMYDMGTYTSFKNSSIIIFYSHY